MKRFKNTLATDVNEKITKKEYDQGQEKAKQLIAEFKNKKKNKKEKNDVQK